MKPETLLGILKYLPLIRKLSLVFVAVFPLAMMSLAIFGYLNPDFATASISVTFTIALIPGVLQCYTTKRGWSQFSCDQTGFGLIGMAGVFYYLTFAYNAPLFITATTTLACGAMWMILLAQAFKYAKPNFSKIANENKDVLASPDSILEQVPQLGDTFGDQLKEMMSPENMSELMKMAEKLGLKAPSEEEEE